MRITYVFMAAGVAALALIVACIGVRLFPEMVVAGVPVLVFVILVSLGGVFRIKRPAWLTLPAAFGLWGACAGHNVGTIACLLCGVAFGTIGVAAGIEVERRRQTRG